MSKRGASHLWILLLVLVIAIVGIYFVFKGAGRATGYNFQCVVECQPPKPVEIKWLVTASSQEAQFMCNEYANAQCEPGTRYQSIAKPTGAFAVPGAKVYGGSISGVSGPGGRAFAGKAFEMGAQSCYTCSCLSEGITSVTGEAAERVCRDNCGGIISSVQAGSCR